MDSVPRGCTASPGDQVALDIHGNVDHRGSPCGFAEPVRATVHAWLAFRPERPRIDVEAGETDTSDLGSRDRVKHARVVKVVP